MQLLEGEYVEDFLSSIDDDFVHYVDDPGLFNIIPLIHEVAWMLPFSSAFGFILESVYFWLFYQFV